MCSSLSLLFHSVSPPPPPPPILNTLQPASVLCTLPMYLSVFFSISSPPTYIPNTILPLLCTLPMYLCSVFSPLPPPPPTSSSSPNTLLPPFCTLPINMCSSLSPPLHSISPPFPSSTPPPPPSPLTQSCHQCQPLYSVHYQCICLCSSPSPPLHSVLFVLKAASHALCSDEKEFLPNLPLFLYLPACNYLQRPPLPNILWC